VHVTVADAVDQPVHGLWLIAGCAEIGDYLEIGHLLTLHV